MLLAAPVLAWLQLVSAASVDVPYLDDYDAVVGFLNRWVDEDSSAARLRLLFAQHNEHRMVLTRLAAVWTHRLLGPLDFTVLNLLGGFGLLTLLGALFASFRPEDPPARRLLAFAPAALFLFHPQYWSALLWPTAGLGSFLVAGLAGVTFVALARGSTAGLVTALVAAACATFGQGNGVFVLPLGLLVAWLAMPRPRAVGWAVFAALLAVLFVASYQRSPYTAPIAASLEHPMRLLAYGLNLIGCAAGFSRPIVSMVAGVVLLGSLGVLTARGYARRNPVLFALLLFVLASVASNALVRSHQGSVAALHQPRYRFYSTLFLSLSYLAWAELCWGRRLGRRLLPAALALAVGFSVFSWHAHRGDVLALSDKLAGGFERWWSTGRGGLLYPDPTKASAIALSALGKGLLPVPGGWLERHAAAPVAPDLPPADRRISYRLRALHQDGRTLLVAGWAHAGVSARNQQVEVVLRSPEHTYAFTTLGVLRSDIPAHDRLRRQRYALSGFRALIPLRDVAPGHYRLGLLVRQGASRHLIWRKAPLAIPAG